MSQLQLMNLCKDEINHRIDRMHELCLNGKGKDATALYLEIREWVVDKESIEVTSLEDLSKLL